MKFKKGDRVRFTAKSVSIPTGAKGTVCFYADTNFGLLAVVDFDPDQGVEEDSFGGKPCLFAPGETYPSNRCWFRRDDQLELLPASRKPAKPVTQAQQVLRHLKRRRKIASWQAIELYRITRLSARVMELRADGHAITGKIEQGVYTYRLRRG